MKRTPKATLKMKGSFVVQGEKNEPLHSGKRSSQYYDGKNSRCEDFQLGSYLERGLFGWEGNTQEEGLVFRVSSTFLECFRLKIKSRTCSTR